MIAITVGSRRALSFKENLVKENLPERFILDYQGQSITFIFLLGSLVVFLVLAGVLSATLLLFLLYLSPTACSQGEQVYPAPLRGVCKMSRCCWMRRQVKSKVKLKPPKYEALLYFISTPFFPWKRRKKGDSLYPKILC